MEGIVLGSEEGGVVKKRGQLFCKTAGVEPRRKHQTVHQMRRQEKRNTVDFALGFKKARVFSC
jgi:hypothetical protein